jgi:hypothetical protein
VVNFDETKNLLQKEFRLKGTTNQSISKQTNMDLKVRHLKIAIGIIRTSSTNKENNSSTIFYDIIYGNEYAL